MTLIRILVFPFRLIIAVLNMIRWIVGTVLALFACTMFIAVIYFLSTRGI